MKTNILSCLNRNSIGKRLLSNIPRVEGVPSRYCVPEINIDALIKENTKNEITCFYERFGLSLKLEDTKIFQDPCSHKENNSQLSLFGYFATKKLTNQLINLHYQCKLPPILESYFLNFLVSREIISSVSDLIGLTDIVRVVSMNTKPELLNKPLIEQIKGFDYTTISKCSRISSDDIKCSAYFSLIKAIKDELGEQEAVRFLENTLFPKLANVNLEEINPQHLSGLLNEFLTNEGLSVFKVNYTKSTNEILIKQPPIYCASVISEGRVIGTASHFLVSKAFQYAKIQAISTTINRYYIENIEL